MAEDSKGASPEQLRSVGYATAEAFLDHLVRAAARQPLSGDDMRRLFREFRAAEPVALARLFGDAPPPPAKAPPQPNANPKRTHAFERALVRRFEVHFDNPTREGQRLSRRMIIGFTFALTKALGADRFRSHDQAARAVAMQLPPEVEPGDDPRMQRVLNRALVDLARVFVREGAFMDVLKGFSDQINARLGAPRDGAWDADWELTRPLAVLTLDDLFADLRRIYDAEELTPDLGVDAGAVLTDFFAGLDGARKLADRPWLRKPLA